MSGSLICSFQNAVRKDGQYVYSDSLQLNIEEFTSYAILTEGRAGTVLLQNIAGLRAFSKENIIYFGGIEETGKQLSDFVQYVPDDIICYPDMSVEDYLCGIALATSVKEVKEAGRLCGVFGIDLKEKLLDLTFEKNRLIAMIQALVREPKLLLIDHPGAFLTQQASLLLWNEILKKKKKGMAVVVTENEFSELRNPFEKYIFLEEEEVCFKTYDGAELPVPPKVVTMQGNNIRKFSDPKVEILYQDEQMLRFLYKGRDIKKIATMIYHSGCENFFVEELTMEETVFENYERWLP